MFWKKIMPGSQPRSGSSDPIFQTHKNWKIASWESKDQKISYRPLKLFQPENLCRKLKQLMPKSATSVRASWATKRRIGSRPKSKRLKLASSRCSNRYNRRPIPQLINCFKFKKMLAENWSVWSASKSRLVQSRSFPVLSITCSAPTVRTIRLSQSVQCADKISKGFPFREIGWQRRWLQSWPKHWHCTCWVSTFFNVKLQKVFRFLWFGMHKFAKKVVKSANFILTQVGMCVYY